MGLGKDRIGWVGGRNVDGVSRFFFMFFCRGFEVNGGWVLEKKLILKYKALS